MTYHDNDDDNDNDSRDDYNDDDNNTHIKFKLEFKHHHHSDRCKDPSNKIFFLCKLNTSFINYNNILFLI